MPAVICMLRAVNVGGHNQLRMDVLRALCTGLGLGDVKTYVQSGNVVFHTRDRDMPSLADKIESAIEGSAGFRPAVILRTAAEMKQVVSRNPFAGRPGMEPAKLAVSFLKTDAGPKALEDLRKIKTAGEELQAGQREIYTYFPNGMGKSKLSMALIERTLRTPITGRNWNTVTKLLEMGQALEGPANETTARRQ